jgi:DNA transformation protein and related proteins
MGVSKEYLAYVVDQLAAFDRVVTRRMFGGAGLYARGLFFALISDDALYLKVDDATRGDYVDRGCRAFRPFPDDPNGYSMSYFEVPAEVLDDPDELRLWARKAVDVAERASLKRRGRRRSKNV